MVPRSLFPALRGIVARRGDYLHCLNTMDSQQGFAMTTRSSLRRLLAACLLGGVLAAPASAAPFAFSITQEFMGNRTRVIQFSIVVLLGGILFLRKK